MTMMKVKPTIPIDSVLKILERLKRIPSEEWTKAQRRVFVRISIDVKKLANAQERQYGNCRNTEPE
jgi:hypothetical protein